MTSFFIGTSVGLIIGFALAVLLHTYGKITYQIKKLRAKKGGIIEVDQDNGPQTRKEKRAAKKAQN